MRPSINYTPEIITDLQSRYNITATPEQLAAELGTPVGYLKTRISALRKDGLVFAYGKFVNEGAVKVKTNPNGSTETFVRKNGKWEYIVGSYTGKTEPHIVRVRRNKTPPKPRKRKVPAKIITQAKDRPEPAKESRKPARDVVTRTNENKKAPLYTNRNPKKVLIKSDAEKIASGYKYVWVTPEKGRPYQALRSPDKLAS